MTPRRSAAIAVSTLALVGLLVVQGGGLGTSGAASSSTSLQPGQNLKVTCPNTLTVTRPDTRTAQLACAANTTTTTVTSTTLPATTTTRPPVSGACKFQSGATPAFCDTFDSPAGTGSRSGDLNGTVWGVSRLTGNQSPSQTLNGWAPTALNDCGNTATVSPPQDVVICDGQLHDSVDDGGTVTALAMYPKQPFDFSGRTGSVVFDVSNDSQSAHAAWPEFWVTDQPAPAPFLHENGTVASVRNGFGLRFAGCASCVPRTGGIDSAVVINNYVANDTQSGGNLAVNYLDTVLLSSGPGQTNHYEVQVSQTQIDVYATDAFVPGSPVPPLKHIASIPNAGLTLTRGLVWVIDAHYNGDKFGTQGTHTFVWDNVGFDGPVLPQDRGFDVPDNNTPSGTLQNGQTGTNLGYFVGGNSSVDLTTQPVDGLSLTRATGALLTFNFYLQTAPITFQYSINGHPHTFAWPYPDSTAFIARSVAIPIPQTDLQAGSNIITLSTGSYGMTVMNVDLIMVGGGG